MKIGEVSISVRDQVQVLICIHILTRPGDGYEGLHISHEDWLGRKVNISIQDQV